MKTVGSVVLCVMLSSGVASAATLGPLACTGATTTPGGDLFDNLLCPQFNVAGGTLTSIVLELTGSITGSLSLTNTGTTPQSASASIDAWFFFDPPAGFPPSAGFTLTFGCGPFTLAAGETGTCGAPVPLSATDTVTVTNASNLAPSIGGSTFAIPIETLTGLTTRGGNGLVFARFAIQPSANARVTFEYEPSTVPEPTTLLLVGIGLVGLGRRWRR